MTKSDSTGSSGKQVPPPAAAFSTAGVPMPDTAYLPKFRMSIRTKILGAIIGIVVAVIAGIWILQVVFLQQSYVQTKQDAILTNTKTVAASLQEKGLDGSIPLINRMANESGYCIDITQRFGKMIGDEIYVKDALGDTCYIHANRYNRLVTLEDALRKSDEYNYTIMDLRDAEFGTKYFTCSTIGTTQAEDLYGNPTDTGYVLIVTTSLAPVKEVAAVIQNQLIYISVILVLVAAAVAFLVARSMTKPLTKITKAARKMAGGDLGITVDVKSSDEIGDLGDAFNLMSREISKVSRLQRELVANISHDMRTPLTMIRGYAEMIKDITGDDKSAREEQLDVIVDESNRLSNLVSSVMDLSLLQAGQVQMHIAPFDISVKCGDVLSRYRLLEQTDGFQFALEASAGVFVLGDELRIEQVLYNLVNNAVNHIGETKRITLRVLPAQAQTDEVRIEVVDTGTGIAKEDLPLIWDRYYKPYKKGQEQQGTGLGLSIVKAALMNHHSRFGVESELGVGSTFWFTLPKAAASGDTTALTGEPSA